MKNKKNLILETFLRLTNKTYPYGCESGLVEEMTKIGIFPDTLQTDVHGNYFLKIGESRTIFASHLDTACKDQTEVVHVFDGDFIKTDGKTILGADDKAGVTILLHLIKHNIPGLYYFFIGEEVGCIGSGLAAKYGDFKGKYDRIISFDRRDTNSVITFQSSTRCCSDVFADELCKQFNNSGLSYQKDQGGVYTDSAEFVDIIPECTNISVGYYKEHTVTESQNIKHLEKLAEVCLVVDWENLPTKRDCQKIEYRNYYPTTNSYNTGKSYSTNWRNRDYGYHDDWYDQGTTYQDYEHEYGRFKKTRRSRKHKSYLDLGGGSLKEIKNEFNSTPLLNGTYYDALVDKLLDSNLTKSEIEILKDQYLNLDTEYDNFFYEYLLENSID